METANCQILNDTAGLGNKSQSIPGKLPKSALDPTFRQEAIWKGDVCVYRTNKYFLGISSGES
jgi:hypothetical protein